MTRYVAGRRAEYRTQRVLEAAGYETVRTAGSHGVADVIAWNGIAVRFIQVKRGVGRMSPAEREAFLAVPVPACATREYWRWPARSREPIIEVLHG